MKRWTHRNPAVFAFILATVLYLGVTYFLLFSVRNGDIAQCQRVQDNRSALALLLRTEVTRDEKPVATRAYKAALAILVRNPSVDDRTARVDCDAVNPYPFPFNQ
jgi:hypothetical protein